MLTFLLDDFMLTFYYNLDHGLRGETFQAMSVVVGNITVYMYMCSGSQLICRVVNHKLNCYTLFTIERCSGQFLLRGGGSEAADL